ncbi:MAG: bacterial transcriptional activator domain-containing protein [Candidatus Eisenbacteria bacterium]|nr:bacterial transcriptional activator domain-containing protein [Candidatus Eisenbacteria bacterium]
MKKHPKRRTAKRKAKQRARAPLPRPWSWILPVAVGAVAPLLLLLLLELGLRVGGYGYPTDLAIPVPGRDTYGVNLRFGWRFFPRSIARVCPFFTFRQEKAPGAYRVVILGASAAQGYPDNTFSFARALEAMARLRFPDIDFEFVNTAIVATNSHVVLPIAREFARRDPDLFIVYLGNNEVIGPYGIASDGGRRAGSLGLVRLGIRLRATKVGQLLEEITGRFRNEEELIQRWGGMEMYTENTIAAGDPRLARVYDFFESNLCDICAAAEGAGAPVLLCTVPVNLWDSAPFASLHRADLTDEERARWEEIYARAVARDEDGRTEEAIALYREALAIDDAHAESQYRLGRCLLAAGDVAGARERFLRARDLDGLRFRADGVINGRIRSVAAARPDVFLVDLESRFDELVGGPDPIPAETLFFEHVHPTFTGNYRIAETVFPAFVERLRARLGVGEPDPPAPPSLEECADYLVYTDWNEHRALGIILELLDDHPFPEQYDHGEKYARAVHRMEELKRGASQEKMLETYQTYRSAFRERPDDIHLHQNYIELLKSTNQRPAANEEIRRLMQKQPSTDWYENEKIMR